MAEGKIVFKFGTVEFNAEGEMEWLSKQFDKILEKAPGLAAIIPESSSESAPQQPSPQSPMGPDSTIAQQTLPSFLKEKTATIQPKKFLATSVWLEAKGMAPLTVGAIAKALKDNKQVAISNPSRTLSDNIKKGYCQGDGKSFFVTEEGKNSL